MSEVMTSESIIEAEWLLKGYWSKPRYVFKTDKGAWSDVDVLSYKPETKHLVISESKVHGQRNLVYAYTTTTQDRYPSIGEDFGKEYLSFLRHLPILCRKGTIFSKDVQFKEMVSSMTVQLVCNYVIAPDMKAYVGNKLRSLIPSGLPIAKGKIEFQLDSTIDVFARVIAEEKNSEQNKRYGNPVLDIAREMNRYFDPKIRYAGKEEKLIREEATARFLEAICSSKRRMG